MKTLIAGSNKMAHIVPAHTAGVRDWQHWTPYAAVAWSLFYAALGLYWVVSGRGFPFTPETCVRRYGATARTVRTGNGLDRCDHGRDSCGSDGSGDAAWGARQVAPASLHNRWSTARWGSTAAHDQP